MAEPTTNMNMPKTSPQNFGARFSNCQANAQQMLRQTSGKCRLLPAIGDSPVVYLSRAQVRDLVERDLAIWIRYDLARRLPFESREFRRWPGARTQRDSRRRK